MNSESLKKIFNQYAKNRGYEFSPPTIMEFITDEYYLGKITNNGKNIFSYWKDFLIEKYPTPFPELNKTKDNKLASSYILINSSAIGTGKTFISSIMLLYDLAILLHLKDPQGFYKLPKNQIITFAVSNSSKEIAESVNLSNLIGIIRQSPFFVKNLSNNKLTMFSKNIDLIAVGMLRRNLVGRALFSLLADEVNRGISQKQTFAFITEAINRLPSRFLSLYNKRKYIPGNIFLISSADSDISLLEQIKSTLQESEEATIKNPVYVITAPQYEVLKDKIKYSEEKFPVFVGTYDLEPRILKDEEVDYYRENFPDKVFYVPKDFYLSFTQNLYQAISDILGVPTTSRISFFGGINVIKDSMVNLNPCRDEIIFGNDRLFNYFNLKLLEDYKKEINGKEVVLGIDLAYSNDRLGISMGYIKGLKKIKDEGHTIYEKIMEIVFATGIKPKKGEKIKFSKIREFIMDLRNFGFKISLIRTDTFQSYDFIDILRDNGFNAEQYSVDKKKEPYYAFRNNLYEKNIILPKNKILLKELLHLQEDVKKIDHPDVFSDGTTGTKDISDAVCQTINGLLESKYEYYMEKDYLKELNEVIEKEEIINMYIKEDDMLENLLQGKFNGNF